MVSRGRERGRLARECRGWLRADIASAISVMAKSGNDAAADVNKDGVVDVADIASIISVMAANARELKSED